jgi:CRISPR-associated endonuclease Cas1
MAASHTVSELSESLNSRTLVPRHGVVTLSGYGIVARVERGHLILKDSVGPEQREARFARIGHGLRRLVIIGNDGMISLAALRWLHDQKAAFVMLDRTGKLLSAVGPVGPKDSRLRRAQALAPSNGMALTIARALLVQKLHAQERIARQHLNAHALANTIRDERALLPTLDRIDTLRWAEARAALAYWSAWRDVRVTFPNSAVARVPAHWRVFGARRSPLTGSGRLAVNPPNAMLNYLYAILESEARIAAVAVGLDPNLGMLHADTDSRPSLACDLMEVVRTNADEYVLGWIARQTLRREWFFEERDGNCRLMAGFAARLAEAAPGLASAVVPVAESVAKALTSNRTASLSFDAPSVSKRRRPESFLDKPGSSRALPAVPRVCARCGRVLKKGGELCRKCANADLTTSFVAVMAQGRKTSNIGEAQEKRAATQRRNAEAVRQWKPEDLPKWLTADVFARRVVPHLKSLRTSEVAVCLNVSESYAAQVRRGSRVPHPRRWLVLAKLCGLSGDQSVASNYFCSAP